MQKFISGVVMVLAAVLALPTMAQAVSMRLLVPAYGNPCCGDGETMWIELTETALVMGADLEIILNPASGPGMSPIDPNYVNNSGEGPLIDYRVAGGSAIGYISTVYATRSLADVKDEVDLYYDPTYWRGAGVQVDGIFFDEMSNDLADVGYYQELRDHVRGLDTDGRVVGNPGTTFVNNPSGQTTWSVADYAEAADTLVTFEFNADAYEDDYTAPSWLGDYPADRFAHIVYAQADTSQMLSDVSLALRRKAGYVFVTDDVLENPYDRNPSYWSREVEAAVGLIFADGFESGGFDAWSAFPP